MLSLDDLNGVEARAEGEEWVWGGYDLLDEGGGRSTWQPLPYYIYIGAIARSDRADPSGSPSHSYHPMGYVGPT